MKKYFTVLIILVLVSLLAVGCKETPSLAPTPGPAPTPAPAPAPVTTTGIDNFRLLISDEVNAIEDFSELHVTISSIGVHEAGGAGGWHEFTLNPEDDLDGDTVAGVDLRPLEDENALEIWSGTLPEGEYTKVFIYVESVKGILNGGAELEIKLPSGKLQISKPFTIGDDVVNFVYDITVIKTGKSDKYILKPQIAQSGAGQKINDVTPMENPEVTGEPEDSADELKLVIHGEPGPGAEITLSVTDDGTPVEGASVTVNGEEAGSTDVDGQLIILLPDTPGEVEIEATWGDKSGEIELDLEEQEEPEDSADELKLVIHGEPGPGAEITLSVTDDGTPVEGASVTVNDEEAGSTDVDGQLIILLPDTPGEVEIEATWGDKSGEIEFDLEEPEVAEPEWFEGAIISLNEGQEYSSPWSMTLEGVEGQVLVYVVELEGTPSVGAWAEIEGVLVDNTIEDAKAKIEEEDD